MAMRGFFALLLLLAPVALNGQSEAALREYFEGKTVKLKIAMPGTEDGVDVYPGTSKPLDYPRHALAASRTTAPRSRPGTARSSPRSSSSPS